MAMKIEDVANAERRAFMATGATVLAAAAAGAVPAASAATVPAQAARPQTATEKFRALLQRPGLIVAPEAHCVFAARLAEINGFECIYSGGNMISAMHLGFDDYGIVSISELIQIGGHIARGVDIPAVVDGDQLGETALTVFRHIREYERAGIAGVHLEDTRNPKHQGAGVSQLMPLEEMVLRIEAAKEGRRDPNFTIIARSDSMSLYEKQGDLSESIRRGKAYAAAGADAFFPTGIKVEQIDEIANAVGIPVVTLNLPIEPQRKTKAKLAIHAVQIFQPAMKLYEDMIVGLKKDGQFPRPPRLPQETVDKVMHTAKNQELTERWNKVRGLG
ncbi:MAG: oxaloacetate decarboxylase [Rhodospirillaceae bacterium]